MQLLANLAPAPDTANVFIPRVASQLVTNFPGFNQPGSITALLIQGTRAYGMIGSSRFAGRDEPFCYDLVAQAFVAIQGVTEANCPLSPATVGDWVPPTIFAVTNSRIIVTHPGFLGGVDPYFGWFDISGFTLNTLQGNTTIGSAVVASIYDGGTSAPVLDGVQPGQLATVAGFPAGTTVVSAQNGTFDLQTTGNTHGTTTLDGLASVTGVQPGMTVTGPEFAAGTIVVGLPGGSAVTLNQPALGSVAGTAVVFSGGGSITLSNLATATASQVAVELAGGTLAEPLWGAGNTNTNPLSTPPVAVAGFNGRAWYAVGNAVVGSDSLNPTQVTNASQAVILGDGQPVTALSGLPLANQITGGIIQALIAFKGAQPFYQITGDFSNNSLQVAQVNGSIGTLAPNTICATPLGLAFVAPDGLRVLALTGIVSEPIGAFGSGVSVPFINAVYPSRMCAEYGQNTIRISVQTTANAGQQFEEYWLEVQDKIWTGPHSFPASLINYYAGPDKVGFLLASATVPGSFWFHTTMPQSDSTYTENGQALAYEWQTSLLPDNEQVAMNAMALTAVMIGLVQGNAVTVEALDETGSVLDTVTLGSANASNLLVWNQGEWNQANWGGQVEGGGVWGQAVWDAFKWGAILGYLRQVRIPWHVPIVFKQGSIKITGSSVEGFVLGNLYMGYQVLGYLLEDGL